MWWVGFICGGEKVEREENPIDEEFIGGVEVRLWERRVSEHPELEFG